MAVIITDECISCGACIDECPNNAIYAGGDEWSLAEGTNLDDDTTHDAISDDYYYVVADKCTQCVGSNDEPACIDACPTEAIEIDEDEAEDVLQARYDKMQG